MNPASLEADLEYLDAGLNEARQFLLSDQVFWPLTSDRGHRSTLSLGQLLLVLDRVEALTPKAAEVSANTIEHLRSTFTRLQHERPANLEKKALAEWRQRLNLWRAYLSDLLSAESAAGAYAVEVRQRVLLTRLLSLVLDTSEQERMRGQLKDQDSRLRRRFQDGPFIWDPALLDAYPPGEYWFLYGQPQVVNADSG